ncbi:hypothetical protein, partial [Bradyrhizobium zhanjiangense]|uniref:hypothetical protein n=1 Tax=Bradyrhizobium zhanjiangense TaxID=1325107 RepID=UPI0019D70D15
NPNLTDESSVTTRKAARSLRRYVGRASRAASLTSYTITWDTTLVIVVRPSELQPGSSLRVRETWGKRQLESVKRDC